MRRVRINAMFDLEPEKADREMRRAIRAARGDLPETAAKLEVSLVTLYRILQKKPQYKELALKAQIGERT